jgi:tetratricopeptide (TPR) repeat protein
MLTVTLPLAVNAQRTGWDELMQQGQLLQDQGQFREAESKFRSALRQAERSANSPTQQAAALSHLATVNADLGRMDNAAGFFDRAASILLKARGENDPALQTVRIELAGLYMRFGQLSSAAGLLNRVVAAQSKGPEISSLQMAQAWDALACLDSLQKKFPAAEKAARRAILALEDLKSSGETQLAVASMHLASILDSEGRTAEALAHAERAAEILERTVGIHPVIAGEALMSLALLAASSGQTDRAETMSRQAVALIERVYGPEHAYTGWTLLLRTEVLRRLKRKQEAKVAEKRARQILASSGQVKRLGDTVPVGALFPFQ